MPRFSRPVPAPPAKKAAHPQAPAPQPRRIGPQRDTAWHAMQLKAARTAGQSAQSAQASNASGLPGQLRDGIEQLSGVAMDEVKVHRNSPEPAKLGALAYAKGSDIHLGPGQERHLPHEAWHIVQQAQGRARPTAQLKSGVAVNDDPALEREADLMGTKALAIAGDSAPARPVRRPGANGALLQLLLDPLKHDTHYDGPLTAQYSVAMGNLIADLNRRVDEAYQQSLRWRTLANHDSNFVRLWYNMAASYADNPDQEPRIISARFGYSIEAIACTGLNNSTLRGFTLRTQVTHGHTRPDIVAFSPQGEEIAWIDITSVASPGHIKGKEGAGWSGRPFVYELFYPQLRLRALLNAMNDPYYAERGTLIAGERQIELMVKEEKARELRATLIKLRDDNGWTTGSHNAEKKRVQTRIAFHIEAASDGVEEESQSMKNTRGALEELEINPGPYGFNRGDVGSTNQRVNELIAERSREEIEIGQGQLYSQTTRRIMGELQGSRVPRRLQELLYEDYWSDPNAREIALAAMALKGVDQDLRSMNTADMRVRAMNQRDNRVRTLGREVAAQLRGPDSIDLDTIFAWRQQTDPLARRARALGEVDHAIAELLNFARERGIVFFGRPPAMTDLLEALAVDPPDVEAAREAIRWLHQQRLNEAMNRLQRESHRLGQVYDFIMTNVDGRDQRARLLERDVRNHLGVQPPADIAAIDQWVARAQALDQRTGALNQVLRATAALHQFAAQQGMNFLNRPAFIGNWFAGLGQEPPNVGLAQHVTQWIAQQRQQQQQQQAPPQQQSRDMEF